MAGQHASMELWPGLHVSGCSHACKHTYSAYMCVGHSLYANFQKYRVSEPTPAAADAADKPVSVLGLNVPGFEATAPRYDWHTYVGCYKCQRRLSTDELPQLAKALEDIKHAKAATVPSVARSTLDRYRSMEMHAVARSHSPCRTTAFVLCVCVVRLRRGCWVILLSVLMPSICSRLRSPNSCRPNL